MNGLSCPAPSFDTEDEKNIACNLAVQYLSLFSGTVQEKCFCFALIKIKLSVLKCSPPFFKFYFVTDWYMVSP